MLGVHCAVKFQGFMITVEGMRQVGLMPSEQRAPASAHGMTYRDYLALGRKVAADVCSAGDGHKLQGGIKMPCPEI